MKYEIQKILGEGSFGVVYRALKDKKLYALKSTSKDSKIGIHFTTIREIRILQTLKHKNIAKYIETYIENNKLFIVQSFYPYDLASLMRGGYNFNFDKIYHIIFEIISGLKYLHSKNIIHRDLKPANIFLNVHGHVKIGDFGISREKGSLMTNGCTTLVYRAPELLLGDQNYSFESDLWGLGCIIYEFFEKSPPFEENCELSQINKIISTLGLPKESYPFMEILNFSKFNRNFKTNFYNNFFKKYTNFFHDALPNKNLLLKTLQINPDERWDIQKLYDIFNYEKIVHIRSNYFNATFKDGIREKKKK